MLILLLPGQGAEAGSPLHPSPGFLRTAFLYGPAPHPTLGSSFLAAPRHEPAWADTTTQRRPQDPWLAFDKVQHVTFSFLWTLGSQYTLVNKAAWSERRALPLSIGISVLVGVSKELYDWRVGSRRYFSRRDLIADAVGILFATGLIVL